MAVSPRLPINLEEYRSIDIINKQCWSLTFDDKLIDKSFIDAIQDSDLSGRMMTSSIPNPLARLYMFKNAFEFFTDDRNKARFNNDNPYAGLVSDALDLLQLLFENRDNDRIRVAEWNVDSQIEKLSASKNEKHKKFADALKLYFDRDKELKKFGVIQLIYFHTTSGTDILIGGTSPFSYVYTSPNWKRSIVDHDLSDDLISYDYNGNRDIFFDADFRSFEQRQNSFKEYLIHVADLDKESSIANYILKYKKSNKTEIKLNGSPVLYKTKQNDDAFPDGVPLKLSNAEVFLTQSVIEETASDNFLIAPKSDRYKNNIEQYDNRLPILFARNLNYKGRLYGIYDYNKDEDPPFYIKGIPVCQRTIPGTPGVKYPILMEQDFFFDELLRLPYDVDTSDSFYGPTINTNGSGYKYLLPIKPIFFDFFDSQHINELLEFRVEGESVMFILKVPVKGEDIKTITFTKRYTKVAQQEINIGLSLFPSIRYVEGRKKVPIGNSHNLLVFNDDPDQKSTPQYDTLKFYSYTYKEKLEEVANVVQKDRCSNMNYGFSQHFHIPDVFDVIEVTSVEGICGLILPKFKVTEGGTNSFFASIDFGTSNTFVACQYGDKEPEPLSFSPEMIAYLNKETDSYGSIKQGMVKSLKTEFIPTSIETKSANNEQVSFPISTIMSVDTSERHISDSNLKRLFLYSNIGFYADKETDAYKSDQNKFKFVSNIKPSFELSPAGDYKVHVENFLEEIFWLIKCKAIETQANLSELKVIWTYPSTGGFKSEFEKIFPKLSEKVFGRDIRQQTLVDVNSSLSESIAPFIYLERDKNTIVTTGNFLNIDIGGGTTDIVCNYEETTSSGKRRNYKITSVKFAGNDLWGSGIRNDENTNAFIKAWEEDFAESIDNADSSSLEFLRYKALVDRGRVSGADSKVSATDKVNLLFKYNSRLEFDSIFSNKKSKKDLLKFSLYLHFTSILHYTLCWLQQIEIERFTTISFTGKGSSYIKIIFSNDKLKKFIDAYIKSYNEKKGSDVSFTSIWLPPNPKEITAYGAIKYLTGERRNIEDIRPIHFLSKSGKEQASGGGYKAKKASSVDFAQLENDCLKELKVMEDIIFGSDQIISLLEESFNSELIYDKLFSEEDNLFTQMAKSSFSQSAEVYTEERDGTVFFYAFKETMYKLTNYIYEKCR